MSTNMFNNKGMMSALGGIGAGFGDLFGNYQNPADSAMPYLSQFQNELPGYYNSYINQGQQAGSSLQQQLMRMAQNPGGTLNSMGQQFHQSPGFQFQVQQATNAANRAAAAGGMAGSPQEQQNLAGTINGYANQDYYNWLDHAQNMYGEGVNGLNSMYNTGFNASNNLAVNEGNLAGNEANLAYNGTNNQNQNSGGGLGSLIGGGLQFAGGMGWL